MTAAPLSVENASSEHATHFSLGSTDTSAMSQQGQHQQQEKQEKTPPDEIPSTSAVPIKSATVLPMQLDEYALPSCALPPQSELEIVEKFVLKAVESQHQNTVDGSSVDDGAAGKAYAALINSLRRPEDPEMIFKILIALRTAGRGTILHYLTTYPQIHAHLNHLIYKLDSINIPRSIMKDLAQLAEDMNQDAREKKQNILSYYENGTLLTAQLHLLLALVSAKSVNIIPALSCIWKMLSKRTLPIISTQLHATLFHMMRLCPKARTEIFPLIASNSPYWRLDKEEMTWYFVQCLRVSEYVPNIRRQLLELVIDKCLEIDVHINIKDNGEVIIDQQTKVDDEKKDAEEGVGGKNNIVVVPANDLGTVRMTKVTFSMDAVKRDAAATTVPDVPPEVAEVNELSDKLDSLLSLLFETLCKKANGGSRARELYYEVLPVFESTILTTHKSKFTQYCMFLLCGLEAEALEKEDAPDRTCTAQVSDSLGDQLQQQQNQEQQHAILHRDFAAKLLEIVMDPFRATLTRQSGACYLASFVSRASYVGPETVCETISALLRWAESYIESTGTYEFRAADAREQTELHSLFYTVCQATFYIMCFRGAEAIRFHQEALEKYESKELDMHGDDDGDDDMFAFFPDPELINLGSERWTFLCCHELQPLKFCLESVRSEFLHIAHAFDLVEGDKFDELVVDAKRMSTGRVNKKAASRISTAATLEKKRQDGGVGGLGRGSNPLKSFFPFDPLLLCRSHEFIEPFYKYWEGPVEEEDVLVIDDGSEAEEEGAFEMDEDDIMMDEDVMDESVRDIPVIVSDQDLPGCEIDDDDDDRFSTPNVVEKKQEQRHAWSEATKRPRSYSVDNGSW